MDPLPNRPGRLTCYLVDGAIFEAPVEKVVANGVFVPCLREDIQLTSSVRVDFHSEPPLAFFGQVATWVKGRGVRIEALLDTPPRTLEILSRWAEDGEPGFDVDIVEEAPDPEATSPVAKSERPAPTQRAKTPIPEAPPVRAGTQVRRVLAIDDDPGVLRMLSRRLKRVGYEVECVSSPPDALELLHRREFDAVLLDWMLPAIPGYDMLKELKANHSHVPVAVVSGSLWWADAEKELLGLGASLVLTKPIDLERVVEWLAEATNPYSTTV